MKRTEITFYTGSCCRCGYCCSCACGDGPVVPAVAGVFVVGVTVAAVALAVAR